MSEEEKKALVFAILAKLIAKSRKKQESKQPTPSDILSKALSRQRILPGAQVVRSGRPMTDILAKIRKKQRRAVNSEYFKYRGKVVKGPQKALIVNNRKQVRKAYKRK